MNIAPTNSTNLQSDTASLKTQDLATLDEPPNEQTPVELPVAEVKPRPDRRTYVFFMEIGNPETVSQSDFTGNLLGMLNTFRSITDVISIAGQKVLESSQKSREKSSVEAMVKFKEMTAKQESANRKRRKKAIGMAIASAFGVLAGAVITAATFGAGGMVMALSIASLAIATNELICVATGRTMNSSLRRDITASLPHLVLLRDVAFGSSQNALNTTRSPKKSGGNLPRLTPKEQECLQWVAVGKSTWQIAKILSCSEAVVNFHLTNVRNKLKVNSRVAAVAKAVGTGLISPY
jgi:DNA-binding CsgD family transcriptional regulator